MQALSGNPLWLLVASFFLSANAALADGKVYSIERLDDEFGQHLQFLSCDGAVKPVMAVSDLDQVVFELVDEIGPCKRYRAVAVTSVSLSSVLLEDAGQVVIHAIPVEEASFLGLSSEVRSVLIFVGGLIAAMMGRVLALVLDPVYHSLKLMMKYRATKKFFLSVSDSFEKDFAISEDLLGVARGEFLTNFFLTTKLRQKIKSLISYIEDWKQNELTPKEFRERLSKL